MINFTKYRKIYFIFTLFIILASVASLLVFGLKPGIDFTGGSILELEYIDERPENKIIRDKLNDINLGEIYVQPTGDKGVILRMKDVSEDVHQQIIQKLSENSAIEEKRFESIGSVIGKELKGKSIDLIIISLLAIVLYIAFAFRRVSRPISSWQYSFAALFILSHDVMVPLGLFAFLGKYYGVQLTIPIVSALLTVVGYAINNVVVVYDRVRENILRSAHRDFWENFEEIINTAISQTLTRQINTSLTTLFPLFAIFFLGGETLKYFALALIVGIITGTYSSIFLAGPILVSWVMRKKYRIDKCP